MELDEGITTLGLADWGSGLFPAAPRALRWRCTTLSLEAKRAVARPKLFKTDNPVRYVSDDVDMDAILEVRA